MHIVTDRDDSEPEVMTSLPRSRPVRRSTKRADRPPGDSAGGAGATTAKATAKARPRAGATTKPPATAKRPRAAATTKPPATARRPRAAAATTKPTAAAKRGAASNGSTATRRPPRTTPRPRPVAAADPTPSSAARTPAAAHTPTTARGAPASAGPLVDPPGMEPTRKVPAAGYAAPAARVDESGSQVTDLVTTTVLAASELAQIGLDLGRSALRSMIERLPKP
jgi:hypothetical protein